MTNQDVKAVGLVILLVVVVVWNRLSFDGWLGRFDVATFFLPWYSFLGDRLRNGDVPGWNPHLFSGTPFAGDPESGWMYLPAMLAFAALPVLSAMKAMVASQLLMAGVSIYGYARVLGLGFPGAMASAFAFAFGPFLHWNTYCCLVFAEFATWIPLALLGVELALAAACWRDRIASWFVGGFAVSQMLAGWAGEGWFYAILLVGSYTLYRAVSGRLAADRIFTSQLQVGIVTAVATLGSGLALGAAGVLPRLSVNAQTHLAGGDYASMGAGGILNPPWTLDQLGIRLLGSGYEQRSAALGGAVVVLALLAPFMARRAFPTLFFVILTFVAWTLTQDTTPLHQIFYLIPRYQSLHEHDPWRTMALSGIGPAMLSGAAVDRVMSWQGRRRLVPLTFLPLALMVLIAAWLNRAGHEVGWSPFVAAALATAIVASVAVTPFGAAPRLPDHRIRSVAKPLLLVLIVIQPLGMELSGSWLSWPKDESWAPQWRASPVADATLATEVSTMANSDAGAFLQERAAGSEPFRYVGYGGIGYPGESASGGSYMSRRFDPNIQALLVNGRPVFLGLYDIQGYNPLQLARYAEFVGALNGRSLDYHVAYLLPSGTSSPMLDLLDVQYVVIDRRLPRGRDDVTALSADRDEVFRDDRVIVLSKRGDLPHAWIVHDVQVAQGGEALEPIATGKVDPYQTAFVEGPFPSPGVMSDPGMESATVLSYEPDAMTVATSSQSDGLLVVSEIYAEGWNAYVDGERAEVLPTDHALRGVPVPAGEHVVKFQYEPRSLKLGLVITGLATLCMVTVFFASGVTWWRRS